MSCSLLHFWWTPKNWCNTSFFKSNLISFVSFMLQIGVIENEIKCTKRLYLCTKWSFSGFMYTYLKRKKYIWKQDQLGCAKLIFNWFNLTKMQRMTFKITILFCSYCIQNKKLCRHHTRILIRVLFGLITETAAFFDIVNTIIW